MAPKGRRSARRLLLQALYQSQLSGHSLDEIVAQFVDHPQYASADSAYFNQLLEQILANAAQLDADINDAGDIAAERLDPVERSVLWIAFAELRFQNDVPVKVIINEAVELAKEFGAEGGYRYVNGALDKLASQMRSAES